MSFHLFISHSSKDIAEAELLCSVLEKIGISCWIAPRNIKLGTDWDEAIVDGIESSKATVLLLSENSNKSEQVKREISIASSRQIPIAPIRLDNVELSSAIEFHMGRSQWFDAITPPLASKFLSFGEHIKRALSLEHSTPPEPKKPEPTPAVAPQKATPEALASVALIQDELPRGFTLNADQSVTREIDGARMVCVSGGEFQMGVDNGQQDEGPRRKVKIGRFLVDVLPVSREQYARFLNLWGSDTDDAGNLLHEEYFSEIERLGSHWSVNGDSSTPITGVTWYGAKAFAEWACSFLPSEAQMEYLMSQLASGDERSDDRIEKVIGTIRHWCHDFYAVDFYEYGATIDPVNKSKSRFVAVRGASKNMSMAKWKRTTRDFLAPAEFASDLGFRCCLMLEKEK